MKFDLENDLQSSKVIKKLVKNNIFAQNLYAAMCNVDWFHKHMKDTEEGWSCSWRSAGGIVAALRDNGDYMDWYCSGMGILKKGTKLLSEGQVSDDVRTIFASLGWTRYKQL